MIAGIVLVHVLNNVLAQRFASMQAILDSVDTTRQS